MKFPLSPTKMIFLVLSLAVLIAASTSGLTLDELSQDQMVHGFRTLSIYENGNGRAMGARFFSDEYGFILDYLQIQSVPQAFFWVKTPPNSSKGEPHACEHLLLGKGNRGRYVAALEDMALSNSTAYTAQLHTCYHFNTVAGEETFYKVLESKLQALLHPDFTDEEIHREVCHIGVIEDPETKELSIDEKGTVYTEMVSSFEKPWYHTYSALDRLVYGDAHPLTFNSGGDPEVMRSMIPKDMWTFHDRTHHLNSMGAIVSMPSEVQLEAFLEEMSAMLVRCEDKPSDKRETTIKVQTLPAPENADEGSTLMVTYPSENPDDPGYLMYAWPPQLDLTYNEQFLLEIFLEVFANGATSNLYNLFINSETKQIDVGGNNVYGYIDDYMDIAVFFGLTGINNGSVTDENLIKVKAMIIAELQRVADWSDESDELAAFNERVQNRLIEYKKQIENNLNSPPMFGFRGGPAGRWMSLLESAEQQSDFRKSLTLKSQFAYVENLVSQKKNHWREYLTSWKLLKNEPYALGATPDPGMLSSNTEQKKERIDGYLTDLKTKFETEDVQFAVASYKEKFDQRTAELEALKSDDKLPEFVKEPPMTLDDQLQYEQLLINGSVPLVASIFENMSSSTMNLYLNLQTVPADYFIYLPLLPDILTEIGVVQDGTPIPFDIMQERLRKEVLGLYSGFDLGMERERVELVLTGRASNSDEINRVVHWMENALTSPYLDMANLPRMRDLVNQLLISNRNRQKRSEEAWVNNPANAYRLQSNPLYLSAGSFLTQSLYLQRLKWMLTQVNEAGEAQKIGSFLNLLASVDTETLSRDTFYKHLSEIEVDSLTHVNLKEAYGDLSPLSKRILVEFARDAKNALSGVPDENFTDDRAYLCNQAATDLLASPEKVVEDLKNLLTLIGKTDQARMTLVSNSADREKALPMLEKMLSKFDNTPSEKQVYRDSPRVIERLRSRHHDLKKPVYVGLMFDGTQNGVLIFGAPNTSEYATDEESLLMSMASKLFTGYGPHGLFMRTWAAGLAYSNGYRFAERSGQARYYAERCPDVAETMRFVVNELKSAKDKPELVDYAVAQVFGASRAPSSYESRGTAMAEDLVDGFTPEKVREYRQQILNLKNQPELYEEMKKRLPDAYGTVMIGYGQPLAEVDNGTYFLIGPEKQFQSLEQLIKNTEGEQTVYRLYPRDFWLIN